MTDPVSRSQLEEALRQWDDGEGEYEVAETLSETARAVLSAPTRRICTAHQVDTWLHEPGPGPCELTTVALVPVEDGE